MRVISAVPTRVGDQSAQHLHLQRGHAEEDHEFGHDESGSGTGGRRPGLYS